METEVDLPVLPVKQTPDWYGRLYNLISQMRRGKLDSVGTIVVEANTTETTFSDRRITKSCHISFTGLDSNSNSGIIYIKSKDARTSTCTIGHDSAADDRNYSYAIIG
jgi:hypothetical protein